MAAFPLPENLPDNYVFNVEFSVRYPFGGSTVVESGTSGTLIDSLTCGRSSLGNSLVYSHLLVCNPGVDVRDKIVRNPGGNSWIYSDGDEVRVLAYFGYIRFVVVWVAYIPDGSSGVSPFSGYKLVYLMRVENVYDSEHTRA